MVLDEPDLKPGDMTFSNYFGPPILETRLPDNILEKMIEVSDGVLEKEHPIRYGANLAGQIVDELAVPKQDLIQYGIYDYFESMAKQFIMSASKMLGVPVKDDFVEKIRTQVTNMWLVRQRAGEYNPVHLHTRCTLSSVLYLKIPEYIERNIPNKEAQDGDIVFIHKSAGDPANSFERSLLSVKPQVGHMYMFPSTLLHAVYPFLGEGERVSVSYNIIHSVHNNNDMPIVDYSYLGHEDSQTKFEGEMMTERELKTNKKEKVELKPNTKWFYPKAN